MAEPSGSGPDGRFAPGSAFEPDVPALGRADLAIQIGCERSAHRRSYAESKTAEKDGQPPGQHGPTAAELAAFRSGRKPFGAVATVAR
jgi:hypothetical protein